MGGASSLLICWASGRGGRAGIGGKGSGMVPSGRGVGAGRAGVPVGGIAGSKGSGVNWGSGGGVGRFGVCEVGSGLWAINIEAEKKMAAR